jgi:hypothetical protein
MNMFVVVRCVQLRQRDHHVDAGGAPQLTRLHTLEDFPITHRKITEVCPTFSSFTALAYSISS